jgi:predicted amidophosphoribosyltransferase
MEQETIKCSYCGSEVDTENKVCPLCGTPVNQ